MEKYQNIMKLIICKIFFGILWFYQQLNLSKTVTFLQEFPLSFLKRSWSKLKILLIPEFDLSGKIGKAVMKQG